MDSRVRGNDFFRSAHYESNIQIESALNRNGGNRQQTAEELGMARSTFYVKLRELALI